MSLRWNAALPRRTVTQTEVVDNKVIAAAKVNQQISYTILSVNQCVPRVDRFIGPGVTFVGRGLSKATPHEPTKQIRT